MLYAVVCLLLNTVKEIVIQHPDLIRDARDDLLELTQQLSLCKGLWEDASKRRKDEEFEIFAARVKKLIYEVEDIVESFINQAAAQSSRCVCLRFRLFHRHGSRLEIKSFIEKMLKPEILNFQNVVLHLPSLNEELYTLKIQQTTDSLFNKAPTDDIIVGLEYEFNTLVDRLHHKSYELDVISITGMPGIGKTTMASRIFHDERTKREYPVRLWVNVYQNLNIKDLCQGIMKNFSSQDFSGKADEDLINVVHDHLQLEKFLLVLDDVRTEDEWKQIQRVLPMSNQMGKVLITTRLEKVASIANTYPHKLRFLDQRESWKLLQLKVFGKTYCPQELEIVGESIAAGCAGLSLLINIIGGVLGGHVFLGGQRFLGGTSAAKKEWENISTNLSHHHRLDGNLEDLKNNIISLSYNSMPNELKDCFLYLGVFPEDAEIPVRKLTKLWMAEGFIKQDTQQSLEDIAEEKLKDLINRNLLIVEKIGINGEVKSCRVHDMIHQFCRREADVENSWGLFQEIRESEPPISNSYQLRHICFRTRIPDYLIRKSELGTRSILFFPRESYTLDLKEVQGFTHAFKMIRVLDANTIKFSSFPANQLNLRYITLSLGDGLAYLPKAISKLWNLQTLVVNTSSCTLEIKADIWEMMQLRHLKTKATILLKAGKGKGGQDLQTLSRLSPKSCTADLASKAKNLKELGIRGKLSETMSFGKFYSLEKLTLEHDFPEKPLNKLPSQLHFPPRLGRLVLSGTYLEWNCISTLGQIDTLKVLKLKNNAFNGSKWEVRDGDFRYLEALSIDHANLIHWIASTDSFGSLRIVKLKNCSRLVSIPVELEKTLQELYLQRVTKYAVSYAKKIEGKKKGFKLEIVPGGL